MSYFFDILGTIMCVIAVIVMATELLNENRKSNEA